MRLRIKSTALLTLFLAAVPLLAASAQDRQGGMQQATRIETDQKTGTIKFFVNSREAARLDATGLHVRDSIDYEGAITDGSSVYKGDYLPGKAGRDARAR